LRQENIQWHEVIISIVQIPLCSGYIDLESCYPDIVSEWPNRRIDEKSRTNSIKKRQISIAGDVGGVDTNGTHQFVVGLQKKLDVLHIEKQIFYLIKSTSVWKNAFHYRGVFDKYWVAIIHQSTI